MYAKILQRLLQNFFVTMGRAPITPKEWSKLRVRAMELARKEGGDPITGKPFQGWNPKVIEGGKSKKGIEGLMKSGDVQLGKAPKTPKLTLDRKKESLEGQINKEKWIARKKQENKDAIRRFKEKNPRTVEDFRDKGDWDPGGMAEGGIAPLVGEPSYAADFYDDRTPMKRGKKAKKKKLTEQEKIKELIKRMPRHYWRQLPYGKKRYKKRKDLPEGILELLEKDPGFDREAFEDIYWADKGQRWTDPDSMSSGTRGQYSGMTGDISLNLAPFGKEEFLKFKAKVPHTPEIALTDIGKAGIAQHELRHKNILEDRELFETQPEWIKKNIQPGYLADKSKGLYDVTGHELYNRFLDQRYYPTEDEPGKYHPYFDKILKDHWEPHAKAYEDRAKRRLEERRGEGIETLASQGGRIGLAGGGALFKFIEKLFIKASNDIRLGRGKWKGLDQKQRIVQHDNLTKKVTEFQKTGNTEGLEVYFDVNPNEAFAKAQAKVKKTVPEVSGIDDALRSDFEKMQSAFGGVDERTALKQKYPGISDDLVEKILIDDNPQRKADVIGTIDDYMKLREVGKSEGEAYDIITKSFSKNPTKHAEGGRIGYSGGGKAGLPAVTMGTPQMNMQQPQMPAGPQPAGIPGGTIVAQNQMQQSPWMGSQMQQGMGGMPQRGQPRPGGMPRPMAAEGGIMRMPFGLGSMSRRAFMKMMAAGAALPFIGKGISKVAPKAIKETTEVIARGADGMPAYITDLIEVVKAKGTRDVIEGFKRSDYSTVHSYKGVEVIDEAGGTTRIKKSTEGVAEDASTGKMHEGTSKEIEMEIRPQYDEMIDPDSGVSWYTNEKGRKVYETKIPDEYAEGTVRPDMDGKMKDFEEGIDDLDHLELKKIANEKKGSYMDWTGEEFKTKKASGGLARMLGE